MNQGKEVRGCIIKGVFKHQEGVNQKEVIQFLYETPSFDSSHYHTIHRCVITTHTHFTHQLLRREGRGWGWGIKELFEPCLEQPRE